jgi:hypothetical protein
MTEERKENENLRGQREDAQAMLAAAAAMRSSAERELLGERDRPLSELLEMA